MSAEIPEFDPKRVIIAGDWLAYDVGEHTCGGYGPESGYAHEPGCGLEPMLKVADLPALMDDARLLAEVRGHVARGALCPMCSTGMTRRTVGLVCPVCGTDYSRPEYASMRRDSEETSKAVLAEALAVRAERDALAAAVERVRALHRPVGIYDECECSDEAKAEGHEDVEDIGLTCNRMYTVCAECCRDDVYQTEDCASYHDHKPDEAHHCPTIRALDGVELAKAAADALGVTL